MEEKELVIKRANSAVVSRDFSLAARLYKSLLKDDTGNVDLLNALGNVYVKSGDDERALLYYEQILTFHPDNFDALNAEGGIYRRLKKYNEAIRVLEKALETGKNNAVVNYTLGFTYKSMGNDQDAIECFESVIEDNPSDVLAYNHLGSIYAAQKQHQKSISIYKRGLQMDPNHPILQYNLAKSYEAIHDDSNAITAYETALRAKPGWVDAVRSYAELLLRHRKTKVAASLAKNSINLNPQNVSLRLLEGTIFLAQSNYDAAIDSFEKALKIDGENIEANRLLSKAYEKADNFNGALKAILKADDCVKKSGEKNIAVEKQMASVLLSTGSFNEAKEKIKNLNEEAVSQGNPNEVEILDLNEQLCICNEDEEGAESFHKKIAATNSDYTKDIAHKGNRYFQIGNLEKAVQAYTEYLESNNKDSAYWVALGRVNEVLGNNVEALENYSTALAFDPSNHAAEKYTKVLDQKMIMDDMVPIIEETKTEETAQYEEISLDEINDSEIEETEQTSEEQKTAEADENQINPEDVTFDESDVDIFDIDDSVTPAEEEIDLGEVGLADEEQETDEADEEQTEEEQIDDLKDSLADMKEDLQDMKDMLLEDDEDLKSLEDPFEMEEDSAVDDEEPQKNQMDENPFAIDEQPDIPEENDLPEPKDEKPFEDEKLRDEVHESNENELQNAEEIVQASEDALKAKEEALKASEEARKALEEARMAAAEEARKAAEEAAARAAEETRRKLEEENKKQQEQLDALNEKLNKQLEEAKKLSESVIEAAEHAQDAANSAEKAWDAAQSAADAAQSANNAEDYINQVAEEAAKNAAEMAAENTAEKIQEAAKELEEKLAQESSDLDDKLLNLSDESDEEIMEDSEVFDEAEASAENKESLEDAAIPVVDEICAKPGESFEEACENSEAAVCLSSVDDICNNQVDINKAEESFQPARNEEKVLAAQEAKTSQPVIQIPVQFVPVSQPISNLALSAGNIPNFGNSSLGIACNNVAAQVSDMLPVLGKMLENKEEAHKYEKEIKLFSQLKKLGEFLPEDLRQKFLSGRMRLLLDYLIARLSGKPGLMMMTKSLRKAETIGLMSSDVTADSESLSGRGLAKKVIFDLKIMASKLDDQGLAKALITEAQKLEKKL